MYIDLVEDKTGSLNISEISEEDVQAELKYTDWRNMIVNVIGKDDQALYNAKLSGRNRVEAG